MDFSRRLMDFLRRLKDSETVKVYVGIDFPLDANEYSKNKGSVSISYAKSVSGEVDIKEIERALSDRIETLVEKYRGKLETDAKGALEGLIAQRVSKELEETKELHEEAMQVAREEYLKLKKQLDENKG